MSKVEYWDFLKGPTHKKLAKRGMRCDYSAFDVAWETEEKKAARDEWMKMQKWEYRQKVELPMKLVPIDSICSHPNI